jgi:pyruvate formate lyase activating enzyme
MPPAGTSPTRSPIDDAPPARYWRAQPDGRLLCTLCPRYCRIGEGQAGFCYIRQNRGGRLVQAGYGRSTGFAIDPIEKKPLNHFYPGTSVLSFGTAGCNLGCKFCQNWDISKAKLDERGLAANTPDEVAGLALREGAPSIAYTYNDPVIWAEYVIDVAHAARARGLKNVLVTAGYVTDEARPELYAEADAANVDLKAFSEDFYRKVTASHLEPVLETLKWIRQKSDTWLEVTTLLIPGLNDGDDELRRMAAWFFANLGPDVPLHFTAFHPDFKLTDVPATPPETLRRARAIAKAAGLRYVYVGNVHDAEGQTTTCARCARPLIGRDWYAITHYALTSGGACAHCGEPLPGRFGTEPVALRSGFRRLRVALS